jgi:hypothetical protein
MTLSFGINAPLSASIAAHFTPCILSNVWDEHRPSRARVSFFALVSELGPKYRKPNNKRFKFG